MTKHLTREQQLLYVDGELSRSAMRSAATHLQSCWACRTELEHLQQDIGVIHDAQQFVLLPSVPPPPRPWPPLEPRLARVALRPRWLDWLRLAPMVNLARRPVPLLTATVGLLAASAMLLWFTPPSVSAKGILRRVSEADGNRMAPTANRYVRQKVRVTSAEGSSARARVGHVDSWRSEKSVYWRVAKTDAVALDLQRHYQAEKVADLPLSAASYQSWSKGTGAEGEVTRSSGALDLKFVASHPSGPEALESVSLSVRPEDWHVTQMELDFADAKFDVAEEDLSIFSRSDVPADVLAELEPPAMRPEPRALSVKAKPSPDLDDTEVDVRYTLHQIGADLGEPIEVIKNSSSQIVVRAWAAPLARQELLRQLLQNKSRVQLELEPPSRNVEAAATMPQPLVPASPAEAASDTARQADDQRLAKWFGDAQVQEDFTRSVLANSTGLLARLYALRQLADRWPAESERSLSTPSKAKLAAMIQENAAAAKQYGVELKLLVKPLLDDFAPASANEENSPAAMPIPNWQDASATALDAAKDLDRLLRSLLTTNAASAPMSDALAQVRQGLAEIEKQAASLATSKP